jgi:hypothetical protein
MKGTEMPRFISPRVIRLLKWVSLIAGVLVTVFLIGGQILSSYLGKELRSKFEKAGGEIGDVDVNLFTRSVSISDISIISKTDSVSRGPTAQIERVTLRDISLYQFISKRFLSIGELFIANGNLFIDRNQEQKDTTENPQVEGLRQLSIERLRITDLNVTIVSDSTKQYSAVVNADLTGIRSSEQEGVAVLAGYELKDMDLDLNNLVISTPKLYSLQIGKLKASSSGSRLQVDSLQLIPKYSKFNFAQVAGKQIDRINTFIDKIEVNGLKFDLLQDSSFVASKVRISGGEVHSFRDKRQPFRETKVKPLPIEALNDVAFGVMIDTIQIDESKVEYEEFAEEGFETGTIAFDNLNATLTNISNRKDGRKTKSATLKASAKLMGQAEIDATFELPYDKDEQYTAKGTIGKMSLDQLNPPLQNLAFVRIESGTLEGLTFNFNYNDKESSGKVTINYKDLKIDGLKKEKSTIINDLKTLLINTIIKNDKDKEVPLEKRTGTVDFERDRKRQIFNFWWKSLFSGIKSSVMDS